MKKLITLSAIAIIFAFSTSFALPNFWFSGVAYNTSGQVLPGTPIEVLVNLTDGSNSFSEQYVSPSTILTDAFGIFSVQVGTGANLGGSLAAILMKANTQLDVKVRTVGGNWVTVNGSPLTQSILDATSAAKSFSFPNSKGNDGQVLTSNGAGASVWADPSVKVAQIACDIADAPNTFCTIGNLMFRYNSSDQGGFLEARAINNSEFMMDYATLSTSTWNPGTPTTTTTYRDPMSGFNSFQWSPVIKLWDGGGWTGRVPISVYEIFEGTITPTDSGTAPRAESYKFYATIDGYLNVIIRVEFHKN